MQVTMPEDRTIKQPAFAFCRNPECRVESNQEFVFRVPHAHVVCPKCGANQSPMVDVLSICHHLVPHPQGPITGFAGRRYRLACDAKRAYLATATNLESATDQPQVVNCPGCLEAIRKLGIVDPTGVPFTEEDTK